MRNHHLKNSFRISKMDSRLRGNDGNRPVAYQKIK
uniref:Uncharacterized protein n=1 Tax=Neisseria meningitidis alpha275 TaxID=295996 RepID=C6SH58_NEIME|nr:hypothetical protein predicted by Glimmer/Critica [Neisseria meningitidis alpha275]